MKATQSVKSHRSECIAAVEAFLTHKAIQGESWTSVELVDDLIMKRLVQDVELRQADL